MARRTNHRQYTMPPKTPVPLASNRSAESTARSAASEPGLPSVGASLSRYLRGSLGSGHPHRASAPQVCPWRRIPTPSVYPLVPPLTNIAKMLTTIYCLAIHPSRTLRVILDHCCANIGLGLLSTAISCFEDLFEESENILLVLSLPDPSYRVTKGEKCKKLIDVGNSLLRD